MAELEADGSGSTAFCDKTISVSLTTSVSPTIDCELVLQDGTVLETLTLPWTTVHQITNHTNTFGPAENAGDAPFFHPCASGVQFTCNTGEDATDSQGNSCHTATGDPVPFNGTCWNDCPAYGNMWKPSHYTTTSTSSWPAISSHSMTLSYQGACQWQGSTTISSSGATRIWMYPIDSTDYYDQDLGSCYTTDGRNCESGYEGCCHCSSCSGVDSCFGSNPIDCSSTEAGCIEGICGYQEWTTDNFLPCNQDQQPYPRVRFVPYGYTAYEVAVHYTLTYTLNLVWPTPSNPGNPPDAVWVHSISLTPDYQLAASSVPTDRAGNYIGEWAEIIGTMPNQFTFPQYIYCSDGCDGGCSETGYLNNPCNGMPEGSTPDDYTRHEWATTKGGYFAACHPCTDGGPTAHGDCRTWSGGSGIPPGPLTSRSAWCQAGGPPTVNPKPFWYDTLDKAYLSQDTMAMVSGSAFQCGEFECDTGANCTGLITYGGEFFSGQAMEYRQTIPAASQCSQRCPVATTFTRGGWTVQMTVT